MATRGKILNGALSSVLLWTIFGLQSPSAQAQSRRIVFAHYMVTNQDFQGNTDPRGEAKVRAYMKEIQQAQAVGIDGFCAQRR